MRFVKPTSNCLVGLMHKTCTNKRDDLNVVCFSSIVKQALVAYVIHARIRSWNQPVLNNEGKDYFSRKQRELTCIHQLRVRRATHCATLPLSLI